eukprot:TRINITY_DN1579_c0_g2_i1.p1 TRINITY_DN1579_c0_g2~~TRINITY_DN1579_c0_g2_i1.p1  ORF type:complete len:211 (-),score=34.14 TRINITY_DN1579_c0_g2_i1:31-663(-)
MGSKELKSTESSDHNYDTTALALSSFALIFRITIIFEERNYSVYPGKQSEFSFKEPDGFNNYYDKIGIGSLKDKWLLFSKVEPIYRCICLISQKCTYCGKIIPINIHPEVDLCLIGKCEQHFYHAKCLRKHISYVTNGLFLLTLKEEKSLKPTCYRCEEPIKESDILRALGSQEYKNSKSQRLKRQEKEKDKDIEEKEKKRNSYSRCIVF